MPNICINNKPRALAKLGDYELLSRDLLRRVAFPDA